MVSKMNNNTKKPTQGVLYIATGETYIQEAIHSAKSVKKNNPDLSITVITNKPVQADPLDKVIVDSDMGHRYGVLEPGISPYDQTLFLDSDTYVCENLSGIFDLLNEFDLAVTHSPGRPELDNRHNHFLNGKIPDSFPLYNSGVIIYNDNKQVGDTFKTWSQLYNQYKNQEGIEMNQPSFRAALYMSDADIVTLHDEYNCRFPYPNGVSGSVKILHGRVDGKVEYLDIVENKINKTYNKRTHNLGAWPINISERNKSLRYRTHNSIKSEGLFKTLTKVPRHLLDSVQKSKNYFP